METVNHSTGGWSQRHRRARRVVLVTTGGTIEKIYDEEVQELVNRVSRVWRMLDELRLEDTVIEVVELMHKDSLRMSDEDRSEIVRAVGRALDPVGDPADGVVVLHGTDTLTDTGDRLLAELSPRGPVVLTGAMRPFEMKRSDALQNLTEAIFATGVLTPGVYVVAHGRALRFPGVRKDRGRHTFAEAVPSRRPRSGSIARVDR